ncbi:tellurite resistance/C4-dicarboxylate transporter family protein [Nocardia sp. IFM 10818]
MAQRWWRDLPPATGAFVMATGIISIGLHLTGFEVTSRIWLVPAAAVWVLLAIDFVARLEWDRTRWEGESATPPALTAIVATTVLGTRVSLLGWQWPAIALLIIAAALWPVLLSAVIRHWNRHMPGAVFLVCVSTQGIAVLSGTLALAGVADWLMPLALPFFLAGLALYLAAFERFDVSQIWNGAGDQWVATGALAISTLAGSKLITWQHWTGLPHQTLRITTLILLSLNLIGYAILAVAAAIRPRTAYDIRWWATVFPLGMTSVATYSTGTALHVPALHTLGALLLAVAVAAWLITLAALLAESLSSRKS